MIDLVLTDNNGYHANMVLISALIAWITKQLSDDSDKQDILLQGYMCFYDKNNRVSTLLLCEQESQKAILQLLKQPPGEFVGKYQAYIACEEPDPVIEVQKTEANTERTKVDSEKSEDSLTLYLHDEEE